MDACRNLGTVTAKEEHLTPAIDRGRRRRGSGSRSCCDAVGERRLLRAAARGDLGARDRLVVCHLAMVRGVASRYRDLGLPFDDLVQEGALGLLEAIDRYDPSRRVAFETYARFRVRRAIRNALTERSRLVRLPKHIVERRRVIAGAEPTLAATIGRPPTPAELAVETGLSRVAVIEAVTASIRPMSLDGEAVSEGSPLESLVADATAPDPERETLVSDRRRRVRDALARLTPRQREIVNLRFGLDGSAVDLAAVAARLHLSEQRTRSIENAALCKLANELEQPVGRRAG
jgi:RNA polymerase sigma factor (sigma-70 family)